MKVENLCIHCMREKAQPGGRCEHCGYLPEEHSIPSHHLEPFVILAGKYLVGSALGEDGFGITYIGMDLNLEMRVAIKEYYPNGCAIRDLSGNSTVQSYAGSQGEFFEKGREKFINEAKTLAKCIQLPGIVTVRDFFKENKTAYIVMEYLDGKTLKEYLKERGGKISVEETLQMMEPVIRSLAEVHKMNLIHRDISPDNIMILKNGTVKVLDFGGARNFDAAGGKSLSIMLKPGYAPEEQYRTHGEQGPWTDVYALCATMYRCITGKIPPEALERTYQDTLEPLSSLQISVPANVEYALTCGLSVYRNGRFQNMEELYGILYGNDKVEVTPEPKPPAGDSVPVPSQPIPEDRNKILKLMIAIVSGILLALILLIAAKTVLGDRKNTNEKAQTESTDIETELAENQTESSVQDNIEEEVQTEADVLETEASERQTEPGTLPEVQVAAVKTIDMGYVEGVLDSYNTGAEFSIYVYDLQTDEDSGTANNQQPLPASALITLPILYTAADLMDRGYLSMEDTRKFKYTYENGRGTLTASQNGKKVTIRELLESMLLYSDNNAINTMIDTLTMDTINDTCQEAGFTSVDIQKKIATNKSSKENYISARDVAMIVKELYNNRFSSIDREYLLQYMRISDKSGRDGIFRAETLYNNGQYCSQNGIIPNTTGGRYNEMGIVFADGQEYIIAALANGGDATRSPSAISNASSYIHDCMKN